MSPPALDRTVPPRSGRPVPFHFPDFEVVARGTLAVHLLPRSTLPLVHLELVVAGGADGEIGGTRGLATLTAGLLDEGTARRSSQEIAAAAEALGTEISTNADWDGTYLEATLRSGQGPAGLELLLELLGEASFPVAEVERLRRQRLAELRRRSSRPDFLASREVLRALYPGHVYGESLLGLAADVDALDRDAVDGWYRDRLRRAPTALLVAGAFDRGRLLETLERSGEGIGGETEPSPPEPVDGPPGRQVRVVDRPQAQQTELRIAHPGIARTHPDRVVIQVLNAVLGGKFTSRLNLSLRERLGVTYGAWSRFSTRRGRGPFVAGAAVDTDAVGVAAREILQEMERLRRQTVSREELRDARNYLIGAFPYSLQSLAGLAGRLEELVVHPGLPRDTFHRWPEEVDAVEAEAVLRAARDHLDPDEAAVVAVGPAASVAPMLEELGPVTVVPTTAS